MRECARCELPLLLPFPEGWTFCDGEYFCPDCEPWKMSDLAEPSVVSAEHKEGSVILVLRWPHKTESVPLSVGDAFTLATQLTAAQNEAIQWDIDHDNLIKVNV